MITVVKAVKLVAKGVILILKYTKARFFGRVLSGSTAGAELTALLQTPWLGGQVADKKTGRGRDERRRKRKRRNG